MARQTSTANLALIIFSANSCYVLVILAACCPLLNTLITYSLINIALWNTSLYLHLTCCLQATCTLQQYNGSLSCAVSAIVDILYNACCHRYKPNTWGLSITSFSRDHTYSSFSRIDNCLAVVLRLFSSSVRVHISLLTLNKTWYIHYNYKEHSASWPFKIIYHSCMMLIKGCTKQLYELPDSDELILYSWNFTG